MHTPSMRRRSIGECLLESCAPAISTDSSRSISSFAKIHEELKKQSEPQMRPSPKRVSFCTLNNKTYSNRNVFFEDLSDLWYQQEQYEQFREDLIESIIAVIPKGEKDELQRQAASSKLRAISNAYKACCQASFDTDLCLLTIREERLLRSSLTEDSILVGVEKSVLKNFRRDTKFRRKALISVLYQIQDSDCDDEEKAKLCRQACESLSRPSRLFARHVARSAFAA